MKIIEQLEKYVKSYENEEYGLVNVQVLKDAIDVLKKRNEHKRRYKLSDLIYSRGYTVLSLSKEMGLNQSSVYGWLNGHKTPRNKTKYALAQILNVSYDEIVNAL